MNAFELMMREYHLDKRVGIERRVIIQEALKVTHERDDDVWLLRWRVYDAPLAILKCGAGQFSKAGVVSLKLGLDVDNIVHGEQASLANGEVTDAQGLPVAQHFLGGGVSVAFRKCIVFEQLIMGGDDVLNGGAVLGFLHAQCADENALIGYGGCDSFEFRQFAAG